MRPSVKKLLLFGTTAPYADAMLALDFVGSRSAGQAYYMLNGVSYPSVTAVPGWTYTGGTPAGTGSYAPKADGSLQFFPSVTNLLLQSQTFDNGSWIKSAASVTADQVLAPDGTLTADMVTENTATSAHAIYGTSASIISGSTYTTSIYIKGGTRRYVSLRTDYVSASNWPWVTLDTQTGTLSANAYATTYSVTAAPNGFWRVSITWVSGATIGANIVIAGSDVSTPPASATLGNSYTGTSATFYIWGAQLELGSTPSTYIPTTTAAVTVAPPRITDAGYLAEEARTNSIRNNSMVGAVVGTPGTLPTNWSFAGSGTLAASVVGFGTGAYGPYIDVRLAGYPTAVSNSVLWYEISNSIAAVNAQVWSPSAYLSLTAGTLNNVSAITPRTELRNSGNGFLSSGTSGSGIVPTATPAQLTGPYTISNASTAFIRPGLSLFHADTSAVDVTLRIAVPQLELGSFATSPIPTTSVAVTRSADVGYISGFVAPSAVSLVASGSPGTPTASGAATLAAIDDGTTTNRVGLYKAITTGLGTAFALPGSWFGGDTAWTTNALGRIGMSSISGTQRGAFNGASMVEGNVAQPSGLSRLVIGTRSDLTTQNWNGPIRRIVIYPRAMSNSELQAITTAGAY
jgi:hypothetical protein